MADSDDEYDRKRRDKFRGERSSGDAFRTERRDERRPVGGGVGVVGRGDEWAERNPFRGGMGPGGGVGGGGVRPRPDYREYRPRERYGSPGREMPPAKRMRPDWGDEMRGNPRFGGYDPYLVHAWNEHYAHSLHSAYAHASHSAPPRETVVPTSTSDTQTQPAMMSLKQFLDTQDDGISDSEVLRKYTEYKTEFKRQQLNEFFVAHKDEEWFKHKYHPEESVNRKEEQLGFLKKRTDVFNDLLDKGVIGRIKVDSNQSDVLIRLLDTVVIKLEGGTEEDLKILDEKPRDSIITERKTESERLKKQLGKDDDVVITSVEQKKKNSNMPIVVSPRHNTSRISEEENWDDDDVELAASKKKNTPAVPTEKSKKKKKKIRKRASSESSVSSISDTDTSSSSSDDDEEEDEDDDDDKVKQKYGLDATIEQAKVQAQDDERANVEQDVAKTENKAEQDKQENGESEIKLETKVNEEQQQQPTVIVSNKVAAVEEDVSIKSESKEETESVASHARTAKNVEDDKAATAEKEMDKEDGEADVKSSADATVAKPIEPQPETIDVDKLKDGGQPRALHRTSSIFLRNLAPAITKAEIETICQRFNGYLRVAIADPLVERRWYRRGWITFQRDVNIKEICWNLNNQRLRDCEMGAIVNRDLSRRVRPANGITAHKTIVRADIKLCAKITMNLDERFRLWSSNKTLTGENRSDEDSTQDKPQPPANGDDAKSEDENAYGFKTNNPVLQNITDFLIEEASAEEEELLGISGELKDGDGDALERDDQLISVLDRLVLYLRIVHSVDYYNHCEYPYEDEMPNRCGIIHARGPPPSKATPNDLQDYIKTFEGKLTQFLTKVTPLTDEDIKNLGAKDSDTEVEKFVQANTQELAKDKWLCPLSGKKFKGPEFIRKHILNKHMEKVDEVKKEVEFFNNYLRDPKRPQLPEHPGSNKRTNSESNSSSSGYRAPMYPPAFAAPPYGFGPSMMMGGRGGGGGGGGGGGAGRGGFGGARRPGGLDYRPRSHYRDLDAPQEPY